MVTHSLDPLLLAEHVARWAFMEALQFETQVWADLRHLQLQGDRAAIARWMSRVGIVDDWFIEIIWETVGHWCSNPNSPAATLEIGSRWFRYPMLDKGECQIPLFSPTFDRPIFLTDSGKLETPDDFAKRIRGEFETQLSEYVRYLKSVTGEDHALLRQHAQWTALAFVGLSYTRISGRFTHLRMSYKPDATVKMAVRRFSERIGLTLPRRRHRRS
jgi:hypothetical protein